MENPSAFSFHGCAAKADLTLCLSQSSQVMIMLICELSHKLLIMLECSVSGGLQDLKQPLVLRFKILVDPKLFLANLSDHLPSGLFECSHTFDALLPAFLERPKVILQHFYMMLLVISYRTLNAHPSSACEAVGLTLEPRMHRAHRIVPTIRTR